MGIFFGLIIILVCCIVIWRASNGFEVASIYLGRKFSDGVRGATINAIGSSIPELFTTIFFFIYYFYIKADPSEANNGFAGGIGTTAGSAIFNGMIIPAVVILAVITFGLAKRITVSKKVILRDGISLILVELILIFLISGSVLYWWHGLILMAMYGVYMTALFSTMGPREEEEKENFYKNESQNHIIYNLFNLDFAPVFIKKEINTRNAWALLLFTMFIIGIACFALVWSCEISAIALGIEPYFVAVILASAATSVPDTILSYKDALEGEYDDAVANALGSNIFDVCFALGFPLFIFGLIHGEIVMNENTVGDVTELRVLLLILTIVAFFIYLIGKHMGEIKAVILLIIYAGFTYYIFSSAYNVEWAETFGSFLRSIVH